jgi:hypothetical protein
MRRSRKERKGLVSSFFFPSPNPLSSSYPKGEEMRKRSAESLDFSEEFVEKFSEIIFRDN